MARYKGPIGDPYDPFAPKDTKSVNDRTVPSGQIQPQKESSESRRQRKARDYAQKTGGSPDDGKPSLRRRIFGMEAHPHANEILETPAQEIGKLTVSTSIEQDGVDHSRGPIRTLGRVSLEGFVEKAHEAITHILPAIEPAQYELAA